MKIFVKVTFLMLISLVIASCGIPEKRIKRIVGEHEIVGIWELDPSSSALAEDHDGDNYAIDSSKPHSIVLNADGTCRYRSVLQMPTRYIDATGIWAIEFQADDPKGSEVRIELNTITGGTQMITMEIKEESGDLILWNFWSDPDLWNLLEYNKKPNKAEMATPRKPSD